MGERKLTTWDEKIYRLVHHDFEGLTRTKAAEIMRCSLSTIINTLNSIKKVAPQLFPILTKREKEVCDLAGELGFTDEQIAVVLEKPITAIEHTIKRIRKKGLVIDRDGHTVLRWEPDMDGKIARKF